MALSNETLRAVRKHGRDGGELDKLSRKLYGISGTALLAKLIKGESGDRNEAVSSAGARGKGQFMPGTRQEVLRKFGVDPWKDSDSAAKAASLHLRGKLGHNVGLAGYNPGGGQSYVNYILNQKVGDVRQGGRAPAGAAKAPKAPSGGGGTLTRTVTETTPVVDNSALRQQLLQQYVLERGRPDALLGLAQGLRGAQDVPEEVSTRTTRERIPGEPAQQGSSSSGKRVKGAAWSPVRGKRGKLIGTPYAGTHNLGNWQSDNALDIGVPNGTVMQAVDGGVVEKVKGGYSGGASRFDGYQVTVRLKDGSRVFYTHLSKASVKPGQRVKAGQAIGRSGSANGVPHLHIGFESDEVLKRVRRRYGG